MNRYRERDARQTVCGSYSAFGSVQDVQCVVRGRLEKCSDTVDERATSNVLDLVRTDTHFPTITGSVSGRDFADYPLQYHPGPDDPRSHFPAYNMVDKNLLAWEILAKTNPSVPHVNIPAFFGELKDIMGMTKIFGEKLLRFVAAGYLTYRWAAKPLIHDLALLYTFQKSVNNRLIELYALRDKRVLRRRCHLGRFSHTYTNHVLLHGLGFLLWGDRRVITHTASWGTAEWKLVPDSVLPSLGYNELLAKAYDSARGAGGYGALEAAWQLCPWSWLVDWFTNIGTCINASNNSLGLTFGRLSLMRHSLSRSAYTSDPIPNTLTLSGWYVEEMERKERWPVFPVIPVPVPILPVLTTKQWSILGALSVLRAVKAPR